MKTLSLIGTVLKANTWFSKAWFVELKEKKRLWLVPVILLSFASLIGTVGYSLIQTYTSTLSWGIVAGTPELLFSTPVFFSWISIFIFSLPAVITILFMSRDNSLLLSMPIPPVSIIISKLLVVFTYMLPIHLLVWIPAFYVYISYMGVSPQLIIGGIFHLFLTPLVPLSLAALLGLLLAKGVNFTRHKTAFEVVGMIFFLAVIIGIQLFVSRNMSSGIVGEEITDTLIIDMMSRGLEIFAPFQWGVEVFGNTNPVLFTISYVVFILLCVCISLFATAFGFSTVVQTRTEASLPKKAVSFEHTDLGRSAVILSLLNREWSILKSSSTFLLESFAQALILPLMAVIIWITNSQYGEEMAPLYDLIRETPFAGLAVFAIIVLMTNLSSLSATSLSREGKGFALSLIVPVPGRTQVLAKLILHMIFFVPALLIDIIMLYMLFPLNMADLTYIIPGSLAALALFFGIAISIDLKSPLLTWTHPQQAMKQNLNVLGSMGFMFLGFILLGGIGTGLLFLGLDFFLVGLIISALLILGAVVSLLKAYEYADRQYGGGLEMLS